MDSYASIARFYDWENAEFTEDLPCWIELARRQGGPILELGCGSGRVMLPLAREGFPVTGVDSSPAMLALARARLARQKPLESAVTLVEDDLTRVRLGKTFPLILLPFNTFAHMLKPADARAALATVAAHLPAGGLAAFALPNPIPVYGDPPEGMVLERVFRDEERGLTIQQYSSLRTDRAAQLGHITWIYDEIDAAGTVTRTTVPMTLRYFFPNELSLLLEQAGLRLVHLWGDYDGSPFTEESPVLIAVGGKS